MSSDAALYKLTDDELKTLATKAIEAKAHAYCPYSQFRVGAAILLSTGAYHSGANVEIAATPVGICAERCAIAPCIASVARPAMPTIRAVAVSTDIAPAASPCGMCRQFMREFCATDMPVYMFDKRDDWRTAQVMTMGELLPMSFGKGDMDQRESKPGPKFQELR